MGARQLQLLLSCCRLRVSFSKFDRIGQRHQRRCKAVYSPSGRVSCADPPRTRKSRPACRYAPHSPLTGTGLMCGRSVAFWAVEKRALQGGGGGRVYAAACVSVLWWPRSGFVVVGVSPWSGGARPGDWRSESPLSWCCRLPAVAQSNEIYVINIFTNVDFEGKKGDTYIHREAIPPPGDTAQSGDYQE